MNEFLVTSLRRALVLCCLGAFAAQAQEAPPAAPQPRPEAAAEREAREGPSVPLRVQITLTRFAGERKLASMPYTLLLNPGRDTRAFLRMGIEVPVRGAPDSISYKNVGTDIDCRSLGTVGDRHRLAVQVEQSSVSPGGDKLPAVAPDRPFFHSVKASFNVSLRDGETATHLVATDPVNGETVRIEVGLSVVR